jgi:Zn-dependent protease with chaperone function
MKKEVLEGEYYNHTLKNGQVVKIYVPENAKENHTKYNPNHKRVEISKHRLTTLSDSEIDVLYYHERGHARILEQILFWIAFLLIGLTLIIRLYYPNWTVIIPSAPLLFIPILLIIFSWLLEIYCDCYSVKQTSLDLFKKTLIDTKSKKTSLFNKVFRTHPPDFIRIQSAIICHRIGKQAIKSQ